MSYQHILVTGGAGFVGSTLALRLRAAWPEAAVTALDNLKRRGSELNLARLRAGGVAFAHGDIRNLGDLLAVKPAPDLLVDCSAEPSAQAGYGEPPDYLIGSNLVGAWNCLELARRAKARFLFLSTSRVYPYRALNAIPFSEDATRFRWRKEHSKGIGEDFPLEGPRSLYGMTKLGAELLVEEYADAYGLETIVDRCGLLAGPWQMAKSDQGVLAFWLAAHHFGKPLAYIGFGGRGKQVRDFLHIDDFCDLALLQLRDFRRYAGQRFNVGGGEAYSLSLAETTALCREVTGNRVKVASVPATRPADVRVYLSDRRKLAALSGWKPRRDARRLLGDIHSWLRAEESSLKPLFT